jgi:hypothetical protein
MGEQCADAGNTGTPTIYIQAFERAPDMAHGFGRLRDCCSLSAKMWVQRSGDRLKDVGRA